MTAKNFPNALEIVLAHEGGWSKHPADPGGATMKGVTLRTYSDFLGRQATEAELRAIPDSHLQQIYSGGYWHPLKGDHLPSGVDLVAFDAAVNSGPARSARWLQQALKVPQDGRVGPVTLQATKTQPSRDVVVRACDIRLAFLKSLKTWATFGKGWGRRVGHIRGTALVWAGASMADVAADARTTQQAAVNDNRKAAGTGSASAAGGGTVAATDQAVAFDWTVLIGAGIGIVVLAVLAFWFWNRSREQRELVKAQMAAARQWLGG